MVRHVVLLGLLFASPASAKFIDIYVQAQGGGAYGKGIGSEEEDRDFFDRTKGGSYGFLVGAELLFIDGWVEHNQFRADGNVVGTFTQLMLGLDVDFALAPKFYGELGVGAGVGVGTGQQIEPPLDNSEISDKGLLGRISAALEYRLNQFASLGVTLPVTYGYMLKNGAANDEANRYHSMNVRPMAYLRLHFHLL